MGSCLRATLGPQLIEADKHSLPGHPKSGDIKVVVDTGFTDGPDNPSHIRAFDVNVAAGKLSNGKVFAEMPKPSITDGVRTDTEGRVWLSVGWGDPNEDGVRCSAGELLGKIHIPETVANLCFGGQQRNPTFAARPRSTRACKAR